MMQGLNGAWAERIRTEKRCASNIPSHTSMLRSVRSHLPPLENPTILARASFGSVGRPTAMTLQTYPTFYNTLPPLPNVPTLPVQHSCSNLFGAATSAPQPIPPTTKSPQWFPCTTSLINDRFATTYATSFPTGWQIEAVGLKGWQPQRKL
mmetsp:Transcript_62280/g.103539  ORF Transcript_62280/g.103539 Transcript_62280/m.103539 type:complete len:151 (-) Transcript_62280:336-788(-)